ncbi:MAG TPA: hypothetical protein VKX34_06160 [Aequorivita sp.]|nr:hypothetical protein [Aequorivita sp.]
MTLDLSNPILVISLGILFLAILYFWNRHNAKQQQNRRGRTFRKSYYERKKEREAKEE